MRCNSFMKAAVSLLMATICFAVVAAVLCAGPWYLVSCSAWWLFLAIPSTLFAWFVSYKLGEAVGQIWY